LHSGWKCSSSLPGVRALGSSSHRSIVAGGCGSVARPPCRARPGGGRSVAHPHHVTCC